MIKLKEGDAYIVAEDDGSIDGGRSGFFQRDTRWLSKWAWDFGPTLHLATQARQNELFQYTAFTDTHKVQLIGFERQLIVSKDGFVDRLVLTNTSMSEQTVTVRLHVEPDFRDIFTIWAGKELDPSLPLEVHSAEGRITLAREARDGVQSTVAITFEPPSATRSWTFVLAPGQLQRLHAELVLSHTGHGFDAELARIALPDREAFAGRDTLKFSNPDWQRAYEKANEDLRTLLLPTEFGPYPAAGMPNFVNFFGRDALITSMMIGPQHSDISRAILRFLAANQGKCNDPFREEQPGKILHEIRRGELSRSGSIPFGRYYGSVDSTPLFLMALGQYVRDTGDRALAAELNSHWKAALAWLVHCQTDDGLLQFEPSGSGLTVQSWKDSHDSMNHADGTSAAAPMAVAEVQGYSFAAFIAAAELFEIEEDLAAAREYRLRAAKLGQQFHELFWLSDLNTYAMALDRDGKPLAVKSSDPGHLLWCGIVPTEIAPKLVASLMEPECWSGWGLRTLGTGEVRYNPVSYHNGSVWPHDTAIFGAGLARYGFKQELGVVTEALFALASEMPGYSLPELISGFQRAQNRPPIQYTHSCSPQAWAAAGLLMLARLSG